MRSLLTPVILILVPLLIPSISFSFTRCHTDSPNFCSCFINLCKSSEENKKNLNAEKHCSYEEIKSGILKKGIKKTCIDKGYHFGFALHKCEETINYFLKYCAPNKKK